MRRQGIITSIDEAQETGRVEPHDGGPSLWFAKADVHRTAAINDGFDFGPQAVGVLVEFSPEDSPEGPRAGRIEYAGPPVSIEEIIRSGR